MYSRVKQEREIAHLLDPLGKIKLFNKEMNFGEFFHSYWGPKYAFYSQSEDICEKTDRFHTYGKSVFFLNKNTFLGLQRYSICHQPDCICHVGEHVGVQNRVCLALSVIWDKKNVPIFKSCS